MKQKAPVPHQAGSRWSVCLFFCHRERLDDRDDAFSCLFTIYMSPGEEAAGVGRRRERDRRQDRAAYSRREEKKRCLAKQRRRQADRRHTPMKHKNNQQRANHLPCHASPASFHPSLFRLCHATFLCLPCCLPHSFLFLSMSVLFPRCFSFSPPSFLFLRKCKPCKSADMFCLSPAAPMPARSSAFSTSIPPRMEETGWQDKPKETGERHAHVI